MAQTAIQFMYRRIWLMLVIRGIFGIAVGVLIIWRPMQSIAAFAAVIAIYALFTGIVEIVQAFELRAGYDHWWLLLLSGLVGVGFGIAALYYYPGVSLIFASAWTTWWLFVTGGLAIYATVQERQLQIPWGWTLTFGLFSIAVGCLSVGNPPATLAAVMELIAGFAIVGGLLLLIAAYKLSSATSDVSARSGVTSRIRGAPAN
jgi:uncharacterized membrane protein HdeD (DUF308 family)